MGRAEITLCASFVSLVAVKLLIASLSPATHKQLSSCFVSVYDFFLFGFLQAIRDCYSVFDYTYTTCDQLLNVKIPTWARGVTWTGTFYLISRSVFLLALWFVLRAQYHVVYQYRIPLHALTDRVVRHLTTPLLRRQSHEKDAAADTQCGSPSPPPSVATWLKSVPVFPASTAPEDCTRRSSSNLTMIADVPQPADDAEESQPATPPRRRSVESSAASAIVISSSASASHRSTSIAPSDIDTDAAQPRTASDASFWDQFCDDAWRASSPR